MDTPTHDYAQIPSTRAQISQAARAARVRILMYHHVGPYPRPIRQQGDLYCHVDHFRAQMAYLKRSRFKVIDLQTAYEGLFRGAELPKRCVVLTFDDGYRDFYDHAWPVLNRYGFPATLFAVAGAIGGTANWRRAGQAKIPLLDINSLRTLAAAGITIGSHSMTHPRLGHLSAAACVAEVRDSRARLEDILGQSVRHFCYPYGHHTESVCHTVADAGYLSAVTIIRNRADRATNPYMIPRVGIWYHDHDWRYRQKLKLKRNVSIAAFERIFSKR